MFLIVLVNEAMVAQQAEAQKEKGQNSLQGPIDMNRASMDQIIQRTGLDRIRCIRLLEYRREHGDIRSYYELHYLDGFTSSIVQKVKTHSFLSQQKADTLSLREALERAEGRFRLRWGRLLQERLGTKNGTYRGPPSSLSSQLRITLPGIGSFGGKLEKDAGEAWLSSDSGLPHQLGGYLQIAEQGVLEKGVIGPMTSSSGAGLLVDNGGDFLGGAGPVDGPLFTLDAHTGSPDRSSLSGIGGKFRKGAFRASLILSSKRWTARLDSNEKGEPRLRTLYRNGVHRRPSIARRKGNWKRKDLITQLGWKGKEHALSSSLHYGKASHPEAPSGHIRDLYADRKAEQKGIELHYRGSDGHKRWALSLAMQEDRSKGFSAAYATRPNDDLWLRGRVEGSGTGFDPFWSPMARNGRPFIRIFLGADRKVAPGLRIDLEHQILHRSWPFYSRKGAGTDRSLSAAALHTGEGDKLFEAELDYQIRERDIRKEGLKAYPSKGERTLKLGLKAEWELSQGLQSHITANAKRALERDTPDGLLFAHDLIRSWSEKAFKVYWRIAFFDAPAYSTRPYAYENDLLYAFSVSSYYRTGVRSYLLARVGLSDQLTLEGKIGGWAYQNVEGGSIGSGDRAIPGRYKARCRFQLRGSF